MDNNIITYNANGTSNIETEKDVKFTLSLSSELNEKVVIKAKRMGLKKLAYIRMVLSESVNK